MVTYLGQFYLTLVKVGFVRHWQELLEEGEGGLVLVSAGTIIKLGALAPLIPPCFACRLTM